MLSAQALVSRILTPGISIFVNASVSSGAFNIIFIWHHFHVTDYEFKCARFGQRNTSNQGFR
jgi:hypothetical protein